MPPPRPISGDDGLADDCEISIVLPFTNPKILRKNTATGRLNDSSKKKIIGIGIAGIRYFFHQLLLILLAPIFWKSVLSY